MPSYTVPTDGWIILCLRWITLPGPKVIQLSVFYRTTDEEEEEEEEEEEKEENN